MGGGDPILASNFKSEEYTRNIQKIREQNNNRLRIQEL